MTLPPLDSATLQQRYDLLCRALQATPAPHDPQPALETVGRLDDLIHRELLDLARQGSPDNFADIYLDFARELNRFREFCAAPRLAEKTVVAFGGPFSAGKSSLINALIGKKLLAVEVDPTTALPAYVLAGESDSVHALNLHRLRVTLADDELASLTHDEVPRYGSQVARALSAAFVTRRDFPWANLAFIDTPGYTGRANASDRTDANLAATQMNGAHAIVWVAPIKQGDLSEEDLAFLAQLDPDIPRFVVVSHADQITEADRDAVINRVRDTLASRNLTVLGVHAVSARPRQAELLAPLRAQLDAWNQSPRQQRFAHRFKALFTRYQRGLEREAAATRWQLHRINRIATLAEGESVRDAGELKAVIDERLDVLKTVETRLCELRGRFFGKLKLAGDAVGIPLPEPHEVDLLEPGRSNLLECLVTLREKVGREEPNLQMALIRLRKLQSTASDKQTPMDVLRTTSADNDSEGYFLTEKHAVAMETEQLRHHYALLLAAVLTSLPVINGRQSQLLLLLLDAMRLGDIRGSLYDSTRALPMATLQDAVRSIKDSRYACDLMLDALILLSLGQSLGDDSERLIAELGTMFGISADKLRDCTVQAACAQRWLDKDLNEDDGLLLSNNAFSGIENPFWLALLNWLRNRLVPEIICAAERGESLSQVRLGRLLFDGLYGVKQDRNRALIWFQRAAKKKQVGAQIFLGWMYKYGEGVDQDFEAALSWFRKASKQDNAIAKYELAGLYLKGDGVPASEGKGLALLTEAAEQGHFKAQIALFFVYLNGTLGVSKNHAQALAVLCKAAEQENPEAQNWLGLAYNGGRWGVQKDQVLAVDWTRKSAENGYSQAQANLGRHYYWGLGVNKDVDQAIAWLTKAAQRGNQSAQIQLGKVFSESLPDCLSPKRPDILNSFRKSDTLEYRQAKIQYEHEKSVYERCETKCRKTAINWFTKAAENNNAEAQYLLGKEIYRLASYEDDELKKQAIYWLEKAIENGNSDAQVEMGDYFRFGRCGLKEDKHKAFSLFLKAAEKGNANAMRQLSYCYEEGWGVSRDFWKAAEWKRKAERAEENK